MGVGLRFGGPPRNAAGPPAGCRWKGPRLWALGAPPPSARPNVTPGSLPAPARSTSERCPLTPPPSSPPKLAGEPRRRPAPSEPGSRPPERSPAPTPTSGRGRGDRPPGTRATPRGLRSRPLAPAARLPSAEVRPGPRDLGSGQLQPPARDPEAGPAPPPRDSLARESSQPPEFFPRAELPAAERNPGQSGGVRALQPIALSRPSAELPGRAARPDRPSPLLSSRQPAAAAPAAAELARRLLTWSLRLPSMPSPRRSRVGFPRDAGPFLRVFPAAGGRGPWTLGRGPRGVSQDSEPWGVLGGWVGGRLRPFQETRTGERGRFLRRPEGPRWCGFHPSGSEAQLGVSLRCVPLEPARELGTQTQPSRNHHRGHQFANYTGILFPTQAQELRHL